MNNKVIFVTGTSRGIGKGIAQYYIGKGYCVCGCSRSETNIVDSLYTHYKLNVDDEDEVIRSVRAAKKMYGKINVLINNAGIASMNHVLTTPAKVVDKIFRTNFLGTFIFSREVAKVMIRQREGRIINFSTVASPLRLEGELAYAASKSSIVTLTEIMAKEVAEFGITVNAIGPTPIPTDLIKNVPKEKLERLVEMQAIKRFGNIDDIINVINFFIHPNSDFITGQVINLGGIHY